MCIRATLFTHPTPAEGATKQERALAVKFIAAMAEVAASLTDETRGGVRPVGRVRIDAVLNGREDL